MYTFLPCTRFYHVHVSTMYMFLPCTCFYHVHVSTTYMFLLLYMLLLCMYMFLLLYMFLLCMYMFLLLYMFLLCMYIFLLLHMFLLCTCFCYVHVSCYAHVSVMYMFLLCTNISVMYMFLIFITAKLFTTFSNNLVDLSPPVERRLHPPSSKPRRFFLHLFCQREDDDSGTNDCQDNEEKTLHKKLYSHARSRIQRETERDRVARS